MGSYLEINGQETNSKLYSTILISAIREVDSKIMKSKESTKKEKNYFVPDYYKQDKTSSHYGCGNWTISRKGMAYLVAYLKDMCEDNEASRFLALEENECMLDMITDETERAEKISELTQEAREDIQWCYNYAVEILVDMTIDKVKRVKALWV